MRDHIELCPWPFSVILICERRKSSKRQFCFFEFMVKTNRISTCSLKCKQYFEIRGNFLSAICLLKLSISVVCTDTCSRLAINWQVKFICLRISTNSNPCKLHVCSEMVYMRYFILIYWQRMHENIYITRNTFTY